MNFNELFDNVISTLDIRPTTMRNYKGAYNRYLKPVIGKLDITSVTKNDLINLLSSLPPQTRYVTLMVARVMYREAQERELVINNIAATIKTPRVEVKPYKFLTWEELTKIDFGKQTKRIQFLALHGLRWSEAVALRPEDIYDGQVHITKSKHGPTKSKSGVRTVPALAEYVSFPKYQNTVADKLKPYGVTAHSLRKTYAYMLKSSNVHVTTAAQLIGHSNPMMTLKIYTLVRNDEIAASGVALREHFDIAKVEPIKTLDHPDFINLTKKIS